MKRLYNLSLNAKGKTIVEYAILLAFVTILTFTILFVLARLINFTYLDQISKEVTINFIKI